MRLPLRGQPARRFISPARATAKRTRGNLDYLRDVATQAGISTRFVHIEDIGWADEAQCFVDGEGGEIAMLCKLYPWEWLIKDAFGPHLLRTRMRIIEPPWKMLLSSKGLLPILWELNQGHPNLLPASFDRFRISGDYVQKAMYSREGANVAPPSYRGGEVLREGGSYGEEGSIYRRIPRSRNSTTATLPSDPGSSGTSRPG